VPMPSNILRMIFGCFLMMSAVLFVAENESGEPARSRPMQVPKKKMRCVRLEFSVRRDFAELRRGWLASEAGCAGGLC